jgi:magnesium and cobalt transporter
MPDDPDSSTERNNERGSTPAAAPHRSWFNRLTQALSGEPRSRDEVIEALRSAQANGLFSAETLSMVEGAITVSDLQVSDVMVPRAQVVSLQIDAPFEDNLEVVVESGHSRFPVHGEDKDEVLGILLAKDLLRVWAQGHPPNIRELLRPAVLIPESKRLNVLLRELRASRNHMAIVVDEYGGVDGLVTIEDVLEQIVGEIDDEHDEATETGIAIAAEADGRYLVDALTRIDDFNEHFDSEFPDDEYDTIGGLVAAELGHLPDSGEEVALGRFEFTVAAADERRVHSFHMRITSDA